MTTPAPFNPDQSSRSLDALILPAKIRALNFINAAKEAGIELLVTCTYRCPADQSKLYAQGRSAHGPVVTDARAGDSLHQYRVAFDVVPMRNGKPVWGTLAKQDADLWNQVGALGEKYSFEWAGRWKSFREMPHFQYTAGLKLVDFKAGKLPEMGEPLP